MLRIVGAALLALASLTATAQVQLTGRVLAQGTRQPLPQVTVRIVGQPATVTTDEAGRFTLSLPAATPNAALTFSHLGYQPLTVPAAQLGPDVALQEQSYLLGEVEVSYGQLRRLLLRKWQLAPATVDTIVAETLREAYRQNPKLGGEWAAQRTSLRESIGSARYEFRDNGVLRGKGDLARGRGRWQLDEATRVLTVENMGGGLRSATVQEIMPARMVLQRAAGTPLILIPTDKAQP